MPNIPTNISYGTVTGRFILAYGDSNDSGPEPDAIPAAGAVYFTASPVFIKDATADPAAVTILPAVVEATLDSDGYICGFGTTRGVNLVATDDPQGNPVNWTWAVEFRLTDQAGTPFPLPGFSFSLPSGQTVDLTVLSPVPDANGTFYLVGPTGATGPAGPANTLTVSGTTTGAAGSSASVTVSGTSPNQSLAFVIPRGNTGATGATGSTGATGAAATISAGTTTTGAAGSSASVTNAGTTSAAVFNFTIPRGDKGDKGDTGDVGPRGEGLSILGTVPTVGDLPATGNTEADAYIVTADGHLYIWSLGTPNYWLDAGQIQGPPGEGVPTGGAANTFLVKSSSTNYDTEWSNTIDGGTA
jgi:hypothetical protein